MNTATNLLDDLRILEAPNPWYYWPSLILTALVLGSLVFYWFKARQRHRSLLAPARAVHAHEDALAALEKARALIAPGNSKAYAVEVSSVVRRYIENRFAILAPRQSTEEFLDEARRSPKLEPHYQALLAEFLKGCDFLKFARGIAEVSELQSLHTSAVRFVSETKHPGPVVTTSAQEATR